MASLHHTRQIANMHAVYDIDAHSHEGDQLRLDPDASLDFPNLPTMPPLLQSARASQPPVSYGGRQDRVLEDQMLRQSPSESIESCTSTVECESEILESESEDATSEHIPSRSEAIPATASDFSALFPSNRRLLVRHDYSMQDCNMNIRVDTKARMNGEVVDMTLFHLRLYDLPKREFSLRRYWRNSGREVCSSSNRHSSVITQQRPGVSRSLSNALHHIRLKPQASSGSVFERDYSGHASMHSEEIDPHKAGVSTDRATSDDRIKLEFSNYAQLLLKRRNKQYEYDYWGVRYIWRLSASRSPSFSLTRAGSESPIACIVPEGLSPLELDHEHERGGWIPPHSLTLLDNHVISSPHRKDTADAIVASGLVALVDATIRTHFCRDAGRQWSFSIPNMEHSGGPKRVFQEIFPRRDKAADGRRERRSWTDGSMHAGASTVAVRRSSNAC